MVPSIPEMSEDAKRVLFEQLEREKDLIMRRAAAQRADELLQETAAIAPEAALTLIWQKKK